MKQLFCSDLRDKNFKRKLKAYIFKNKIIGNFKKLSQNTKKIGTEKFCYETSCDFAQSFEELKEMYVLEVVFCSKKLRRSNKMFLTKSFKLKEDIVCIKNDNITVIKFDSVVGR